MAQLKLLLLSLLPTANMVLVVEPVASGRLSRTQAILSAVRQTCVAAVPQCVRH